MKYLTAFYLQQGEEHTSLVLQQYQCRNVPVCFVCLCTCQNKRNRESCRCFTGELLEWCRYFRWHRAAGVPEEGIEKVRHELEAKLARALKNLKEQKHEFCWRVLVCIGGEVLLMGEGLTTYILSMALGQGSVKQMLGDFRGKLESGAGILLTGEDRALEAEDEKRLKETLRLSELETEQQAEKHLAEYMQKVTKGKAGILLIAGEDKNGRKNNCRRLWAEAASGTGGFCKGISGGGQTGK